MRHFCLKTDFNSAVPDTDSTSKSLCMSRKKLIAEQIADLDLKKLRSRILSNDELEKTPVGYYLQLGVLMRKWRPSDVLADEEWAVVTQVVVPKVYRKEILQLAHSLPLDGHLGVAKTYAKILKQFFWPGIHSDVVTFCRACHVCQVAGKPKLEYVEKFKDRLFRACSLARDNFESAQRKLKVWYDKKAESRSFKPGEKVSVLFPAQSSPLQARFHGLHEIYSKVNDLNYVVTTPGCGESHQLCRINMLKEYVLDSCAVAVVDPPGSISETDNDENVPTIKE